LNERIVGELLFLEIKLFDSESPKGAGGIDKSKL
jgi:hypothetical protein